MILVQELHLASGSHGRSSRVVDKDAQQGTHVIKLLEFIPCGKHVIDRSGGILQNAINQISIAVLLIIYFRNGQRSFITSPADFIICRDTNRGIALGNEVFLPCSPRRSKILIAGRHQGLAVQDVLQTVFQDAAIADHSIRAQRKTIVHNHFPVRSPGGRGSHCILRCQVKIQLTLVIGRSI